MRGARESRKLVVWLFALDTLCLGFALAMASVLRFRLDDVLPVASLGPLHHLVASILLLPVLLVLLRINGLYDLEQILTGTREYARVAHAVTYAVLIALTASYFAGGPPLVSRSWLPLVWVMSISCVTAGRFIARRVVRRLRRRGEFRTRIAIVGASAFGVAIAEQLRAATDEGLDVVGFLDEYLPLGEPVLDNIRVIGRPADLLGAATAPVVAEEYVLVSQALPYERQEEISRLMISRDGPPLRMAVSSSELLTQGVRVAQRGSVSLVTLRQARLEGLEAVLKDVLDRTLAAAALVLLSPLAVVLVVRAWLAGSRHPLLTQHEIYVAGARRGTLWLFDRRVTSWPPLRGVPALLAVLAGQMSLVGPRPAVWQSGDAEEAWPLALTAVRPGLTGPWRLSGPDASLLDQAVSDLTYVRNYSLWEDVRILLESLRLLRGRLRLPNVLHRWEEASPMSLRAQYADGSSTSSSPFGPRSP